MNKDKLLKWLDKLKVQADQMLNHEETFIGQAYALIMATLVLVICANFVIGTYPHSPFIHEVLVGLDLVITFFFLIDYILRWWVKNFSVRYIITPMAIIDFITILPLFLAETHWQFVRVLRIFRILRLLRVFRKNGLLFFKMTEFHLRVMRIAFTLFCLIFISSGLIYEVESDETPIFSTFFDAVYFSIVTLTTVGFGDIVPSTTEGRIVTLGMILAGILLIPWQFMSLARHIVGDIHKVELPCEKCGKSLHDPDAKFCKKCGTELNQ